MIAKNPEIGFGTRLALVAGATGVALGAGACAGDDEKMMAPPSTVAENADTDVNSDSETTLALIDNVFNNTDAIYQCMQEGIATGKLDTVELLDGSETIREVTLDQLPVDVNQFSHRYRVSTDAIAGRLTDREDSESTALELIATWCAQPASLAAAAVATANQPIKGTNQVIGDRVDWLEEFVGMSADDINDVAKNLTIPNRDAKINQAQYDENIAISNERIKLAEQMASAYLNMQNMGLHQDLEIVSSYGLDLADALNTYDGRTPEFIKTGPYIGDGLLFAITKKGDDGIDCIEFNFGFNIDDTRPIYAVIDECPVDEPTTTSQPDRDTTTTSQPDRDTTTTTTTQPDRDTTTTSEPSKANPTSTIAATENTSAPNPEEEIGDSGSEGNRPELAPDDETPEDLEVIDTVPEENEHQGTETPQNPDLPQPTPTVAPPATTPDTQPNDEPVVVNR